MKVRKSNPKIEGLNNPAIILRHVNELTKRKEATPHAEILDQLIKHIEPIDFEVLVFPEVEKLRNQLTSFSPEKNTPACAGNQKETINPIF